MTDYDYERALDFFSDLLAAMAEKMRGAENRCTIAESENARLKMECDELRAQVDAMALRRGSIEEVL